MAPPSLSTPNEIKVQLLLFPDLVTLLNTFIVFLSERAGQLYQIKALTPIV